MALLAEHLLKPLPADKQIETGPFLEAVSHLPPFFDCLGSPVFTPIKADISGNITVRTQYTHRGLNLPLAAAPQPKEGGGDRKDSWPSSTSSLQSWLLILA
uniref:Glycolipid transfer protein domain-containing protein n=1 Tax=Castor canadensis TaxID=51338 RepID=A0A8C0X9A4_CASCN